MTIPDSSRNEMQAVLCPLRTAALAVSIANLAIFGCSSISGSQSTSDSGGLNDAANDGGPGADATVDAAEDSPGADGGPDVVDGGPDVVDGGGNASDGGEGGSFDGGDGGNGCTASGGTVATAQCCTSASDFPSNCVVGACGCSPSNSHSVQICNCPVGKCFNGSACQ
jgi:hypothetical protein